MSSGLLSRIAARTQGENKFAKKLDNINMAKDVASNVGVGAYGLAQLLKGRKMLRNLKPPNAPMAPSANSTLGSMLSDNLTKSRQADPRFLSNALRESERYKLGRNPINRATSGGSGSIYNALNQADAIKAAEINMGGLGKAEENKLQHGRLAQFLLQQQMGDDWRRADFDYEKFKDIDLKDFRESRDFAGELTNRGAEHLFSGTKDALSFLSPLLKNNKKDTTIFDSPLKKGSSVAKKPTQKTKKKTKEIFIDELEDLA